MITVEEVRTFLDDLVSKIDVFDIIFFDSRGKNSQALFDLEISPNERKEIIKTLEPKDYSKRPLTENMHGLPEMWVFGKTIKNKEIYIKISKGKPNNSVICISFHLAEYSMKYPLK